MLLNAEFLFCVICGVSTAVVGVVVVRDGGEGGVPVEAFGTGAEVELLAETCASSINTGRSRKAAAIRRSA